MVMADTTVMGMDMLIKRESLNGGSRIGGEVSYKRRISIRSCDSVTA